MICPICNISILGYPIKDDPDYYVRDCIEDHFYSTFYKGELNGYVLNWKNPEGIEYKLSCSQSDYPRTEIHIVERRTSYTFSNYEEIETLIFSTNAFIYLPMEGDKPRPDLLIPRLLKLKAFA